ncbi:hypothetical protein [Alteromonas sp. 14N.309.X.WAT.G.H12]|uniref:hypothetical protein n=1 Tax=Alteromonas sp. 14N.309.X.WAT.G.H12 TaxID=3120824 RepID=UPI002FD60B41
MSDLKGVHEFINDEYDKNPNLAFRYPKRHVFREFYLQMFGLTSYFETLRDKDVPGALSIEIGLYFLLRKKVAPDDIPDALQRIEENYQCRLLPASSWDHMTWQAVLNGCQDNLGIVKQR